MNEILIINLKSFYCPIPQIITQSGMSIVYFIAYGTFAKDLKNIRDLRTCNFFFFKSKNLILANSKADTLFEFSLYAIPIIGLIMGFYQLVVVFFLPESPAWKSSRCQEVDKMQVKLERFSKKLYKNKEIGQHFNAPIGNKLSIYRSFLYSYFNDLFLIINFFIK